MSEVNIDATLVRGGEAALSRTEERLVEMTNGCICCTLRDDLLQAVDRLAREGRFDYLLIESSGISEPMPVAATFAFARDDGATLGDIARLDTMVTVVDAANFLPELESGDELVERGLDQYEDDEGKPRWSARLSRLSGTVGQERHLACVLDGLRYLPLLPTRHVGHPTTADFSAVGDGLPQQVGVLVVDVCDAGGVQRVDALTLGGLPSGACASGHGEIDPLST
jgi:hypothetical protein